MHGVIEQHSQHWLACYCLLLMQELACTGAAGFLPLEIFTLKHRGLALYWRLVT